jgi:hypothetical protein
VGSLLGCSHGAGDGVANGYDVAVCDTGVCAAYDFGLVDVGSDVSETDDAVGTAPKVCRSDVESIVFASCSLPSCHGGRAPPHIGADVDGWQTSSIRNRASNPTWCS